MNDYLTGTEAHKNCISCDKCIAIKRKPLTFKYGKHMTSTYQSYMDGCNSGQSSPVSFSPIKGTVFNIGSLRQEFKVPHSPKISMVSMYGNSFYNRAGKDELGAPDAHGNSGDRI
mgnify:CR=1 FL=1